MSMLAEIRSLLAVTPFRPFAVRIADGHEYPVPTIDHIYLPPGARGVIISDDKGVTVSFPAFYVTGLVQTLPSDQNGAAPQPA
jgi:hypothetical protein